MNYFFIQSYFMFSQSYVSHNTAKKIIKKKKIGIISLLQLHNLTENLNI